MINSKTSWIAAAVVAFGFSLPVTAETTHHARKHSHHASASAHHKSRAHHGSHRAHSSSHHSKPKAATAPVQ